jgi:hypothetical protein
MARETDTFKSRIFRNHDSGKPGKQIRFLRD